MFVPYSQNDISNNLMDIKNKNGCNQEAYKLIEIYNTYKQNTGLNAI